MSKCDGCNHEFEAKPKQTAGEKWVKAFVGPESKCPIGSECERHFGHGLCEHYQCERLLAKAYDIGQADLRADMAAKTEPKPAEGSAFQKGAREYLRHVFGASSDYNYSWERLDKNYPKSLPGLRTFYNAAIREALDAIATAGNCEDCSKSLDALIER